MRVLSTILALLIAGVSAYAADVDGTWTGSITGPQGEFPVTFKFKADGTALTGSTIAFDGTEIPIKNGKIDGDTITFEVTFDFGGMSFTLMYKGIVGPEQIKMSAEAFGMPFEFLLKKVN